MKKLFKLFFVIMMVLSLSAISLKAQPTMSFSVHGGYSWLTGVAGVDVQFENWEISGGWFPSTMPMSKEKINNISFALTVNTLKPTDEGYGFYATLANASHGFRYEDSWGGSYTLPMTILGLGTRYQRQGIWTKAGVGYGWCEDGKAWTFEIVLGFVLFGN